MRPFGFVILFLVFWILIKNKSKSKAYIELLALTICVETFSNVGFFVMVGTYELQYSEFLLFILGLLSINIISVKSMKKKLLNIGMLCIISIIISTIGLKLFPLQYPIISYDMSWTYFFTNSTVFPEFTVQTIKMTLRVLLFILIAIAATSSVKEEDIGKIEKIFINVGIFIVIFVCIEYITKNIFHSNILNTFIAWCFGVGNWTAQALETRGTVYMLKGLMREPAHLTNALFWLGLVLIFSSRTKKTIFRGLAVIFIVSLASRSFAAVAYIIILSGIYAIVNNKKTLISIAAIIMTPVVLFSGYFTYYLSRIFNTLEYLKVREASDSISEHIRLLSITENLSIFLQRPFFGIGIGTSYAHAFLPTMLASIGLFGSILWCAFVFKGVANMKYSTKNVLIIIFLLVCWMFTGNMSVAYSMPLLLVALLIRFGTEKDENISYHEII